MGIRYPSELGTLVDVPHPRVRTEIRTIRPRCSHLKYCVLSLYFFLFLAPLFFTLSPFSLCPLSITLSFPLFIFLNFSNFHILSYLIILSFCFSYILFHSVIHFKITIMTSSPARFCNLMNYISKQSAVHTLFSIDI